MLQNQAFKDGKPQDKFLKNETSKVARALSFQKSVEQQN